MSSIRQQLFDILVKKTKELGREVTFQEMEEDPGMPSPNDYAFYYGSFSNATKVAYNYVLNGGNTKPSEVLQGINQTSRTRTKSKLSPKRETAIIEEFVDMYIAADGEMPSSRKIKKNPFISEEEVEIARKIGLINERVIRRLAEEKTGRKFMNQHERRLARQKETISAKKEERTMNKNVEEKADMSKKRRKRWSAQEVAKAVMLYYTEHKKLPPTRRYDSTEKEFGLPSYIVIRRELGNNRDKWLDVARTILNDEASVQRLQSIEDLTELLREGGALETVTKMIGPIELNVAYRYKLAGMSFLIMIKAEK